VPHQITAHPICDPTEGLGARLPTPLSWHTPSSQIGNTAIHWAAYHGAVDAITELIRRGVNVNALNDLVSALPQLASRAQYTRHAMRRPRSHHHAHGADHASTSTTHTPLTPQWHGANRVVHRYNKLITSHTERPFHAQDYTPLHMTNQIEAAKRLVHHGADLKALDYVRAHTTDTSRTAWRALRRIARFQCTSTPH